MLLFRSNLLCKDINGIKTYFRYSYSKCFAKIDSQLHSRSNLQCRYIVCAVQYNAILLLL